jgi:hypothetical protein
MDEKCARSVGVVSVLVGVQEDEPDGIFASKTVGVPEYDQENCKRRNMGKLSRMKTLRLLVGLLRDHEPRFHASRAEQTRRSSIKIESFLVVLVQVAVQT